MPYISTDKKIIIYVFTVQKYYEIDNDTEYILLRVDHYPIILMSNDKLYRVNWSSKNYVLSELKMVDSEYVCNFNDFTCEFAKIGSKCYKIYENVLRQFSIAASNSHIIIDTYSGIYYFIDVHSKLVAYTGADCSRVILNNYDVDSIIFYDFGGCIIYKKKIVYYLFDY